MSDSQTSSPLPPNLQQTLFGVAEASIEHGLSTGLMLEVDTNNYPSPLQETGATFVTLRLDGELRGCMGTLAATQPLVEDVAHNAYSSAFRDPRFPPVTRAETTDLSTHITILSPPVPIAFRDEADLIRQVRPGVDGLILREGGKRGTLLPAVWEHLRSPEEFLAHLKQKAGLRPDYWSETVRVERYTASSLSRSGTSDA